MESSRCIESRAGARPKGAVLTNADGMMYTPVSPEPDFHDLKRTAEEVATPSASVTSASRK